MKTTSKMFVEHQRDQTLVIQTLLYMVLLGGLKHEIQSEHERFHSFKNQNANRFCTTLLMSTYSYHLLL